MKETFGQYLNQIQRVQRRTNLKIEKATFPDPQIFNYQDPPPPMIAIDGSNRWIWIDPDLNIRIAIIRTVAVKYEYLENLEQPLQLINQKCYDSAVLIAPDNIDIYSYDPDLKTLHTDIKSLLVGKSGRAPKPQNILSLIRSLREFETALDMSQSNTDSLIVMDGALTYVPIKQFEGTIYSLRESCKQNKNSLIGVSKRNITRRFKQDITDEAVFHIRTKNIKGMSFVEIPPIPVQDLKFPTVGKTYLAKLHEKPSKSFRVDIDIPDSNNVGQYFSHLAYYSKVAAIPGYPFPLVDAHNIAILLRRIPDMYNHELIEEGLKLGMDEEIILKNLIINERMELDPFHRHLDEITR